MIQFCNKLINHSMQSYDEVKYFCNTNSVTEQLVFKTRTMNFFQENHIQKDVPETKKDAELYRIIK